MSGRQKDVLATVVRAAASLLEPFYAGITATRNWMYDRGLLPTHRADRPVICIGNITTGGTGKTPVVRWLAQKLHATGLLPAILMRGYKPSAAGSDEQSLLCRSLDPSILVQIDPDRVRGAAEIIRSSPAARVIVLDDGFQHRRLHRDFDLVLIDATSPFGFDHLLPRGLLREPLSALRRASAFLITRSELASAQQMRDIQQALKQFAPHAHVFRSMHRQQNVEPLIGRAVVAACGIGNPDAFQRQLRAAGVNVVATRWFHDHHRYSGRDVDDLQARASAAGASAIAVTEKDWVKLLAVPAAASAEIPFVTVGLEIVFADGDEQKLFDQIRTVVGGSDSRG